MYLHKIKLTIVLIAAVLICSPINSFAMDKIIAVVNDELITQSDLNQYIQSTYTGLASQGYSEEELEKIRLDLEINGIYQIIEDKLILSEANEIGITINDNLVNERIDEIKARYPDEETFLDALAKSGASLTDIRNKILDQLKIKFLISHEVRSKIFVNPQEVTDYYTKTKDNYMKKERVKLDSIFVAFDENKTASRNKAERALETITNGAEFAKVREQYSDASPIGIVERGQLMQKIEDVIFNLDINETSSLVEVDNGVYIFKLLSKLPRETAGLNEVKENIYNYLFNKKFEKRFNDWIKQLKKDAYIEIK